MKTTPILRALALVLTLTGPALHAQVPQILNYQGRVAGGDPPVNFDGSGANMTPIPATVFTNPDVRLRVWFDDVTASGSQLLTPDQRIAAVGYAMVAVMG